MSALANLLIGSDQDLDRRNMTWNMLGSFIYAFASMALTIAVVAISGEDEGGIFAFAFSTFGQHMFMAAYFGMRPFHITDILHRYSFGEYLRLRILTCSGAALFGLFYVLAGAGTYTVHKCAVIMLMVLYKVIDGFADVYEAEFQRDGRLYLTGKSNTFRTILSVSVFLGTLLALRQSGPAGLTGACAAAVLAQAAGVVLLDGSVIGRIGKVTWDVRPGKVFSLFRENLVLFLSAILDFYVFSAAKYAIDANMADRYQAVFTAIFMPTNVINLVAGFVIRPFVTKMSDAWNADRPEDFRKTVQKLAMIIAGLTVLAVGGAWFLGIPVLSLLYPKLGYMLADCRSALIVIILGGACNAYINLFYYTLVIMNRKSCIFAGYVLAAAFAVLVSNPAVRAAGIFGGAVSYLLLMILLAGFFMILSGIFYLRRRKPL